ncbi:MAG: hypothetical protein MJK04_11795 [Psychrosphaera sp.]|nr:hypothetical protein [Psychrosphaera sp.]
MQQLANKEKRWRKLPKTLSNIKNDTYFSRHERHYVFFRELSNHDTGIVSILHQAMDMPARLRNDLS